MLSGDAYAMSLRVIKTSSPIARKQIPGRRCAVPGMTCGMGMRKKQNIKKLTSFLPALGEGTCESRNLLTRKTEMRTFSGELIF